MTTLTEEGLAERVDDLRKRIRAHDGLAYFGYITDVAVKAVAREQGMDWRSVHKAFRREHPVTANAHFTGGQRPKPEAVTAAMREIGMEVEA